VAVLNTAKTEDYSAPEPPHPIDLSAVICTYNRYELLPDAIESLRNQNVPSGLIEIIIVDNSPDRAGAAKFGQQYAGVAGLTYLVEPTPGLANARNVGTREARGRIVAFIDDDARARPSWAAELIRAHEAYDGRAGIIGGPIVPRWPGEPPPWLNGTLLGYLSILDRGDVMRELSAEEWLCGCNMSFARQTLIAAGGFSTALGRNGNGAALLSNEELETTDRIRAMGKLAVYAPRAAVEHVISAERLTQHWFRRRVAWQAVSDILAKPEQISALSIQAAARLAKIKMPQHPLSLFSENSDAVKFRRELETVYNFVVLALCADENLEPTPRRATGTIRKLCEFLRHPGRGQDAAH
jgi:glycosyltransferase involved in cell wall biosynthesis